MRSKGVREANWRALGIDRSFQLITKKSAHFSRGWNSRKINLRNARSFYQ